MAIKNLFACVWRAKHNSSNSPNMSTKSMALISVKMCVVAPNIATICCRRTRSSRRRTASIRTRAAPARTTIISGPPTRRIPRRTSDWSWRSSGSRERRRPRKRMRKNRQKRIKNGKRRKRKNRRMRMKTKMMRARTAMSNHSGRILRSLSRCRHQNLRLKRARKRRKKAMPKHLRKYRPMVIIQIMVMSIFLDLAIIIRMAARMISLPRHRHNKIVPLWMTIFLVAEVTIHFGARIVKQRQRRVVLVQVQVQVQW
mmetsp:Transcript_52142/g.86272  ORF Transcript_52142/g.86272 Transcript_52142/m.86272 type:complete len:256 (-) Transcript_52142:147-914(-)